MELHEGTLNSMNLFPVENSSSDGDQDNQNSSIDELPKMIEEHPFHPEHTLYLREFGYTSERLYCHSCHKKISQKKTNHDLYYYECYSCYFNMHVDCVLMERTTIGQGEPHIQHFSHQHPMVVVNANSTNDAKYCFGCNHSLWELGHHDYEKTAYCCPKCDYFLHKSCAELPREIKKHPLHSHPLFLSADHLYSCKDCRNRDLFLYHCEQDQEGCDQYFSSMCINCCLPPKTIKYRGHKHLLRFFTEVVDAKNLMCKAHYSYCKQNVISDDLKGTESYWFSCVICDFHIHLLCGPLPCTIKSSFHTHPLQLVDSVVDEDEVDAEYFCDVCEFTRDPGICVYYCAPCKFVVHVRCVITEVIKALQQNLEYVGLRTVCKSNLAIEMEQKEGTEDENHDITKKKTEDAPSLNDIIEKLKPDEEKILNRDFYWDTEKQEAVVRESSSQVINGKKELVEDYSKKAFQYSDEKFMEFVHKLHYSSDKSTIESSFLTQKMLCVKDYMVPRELGGVLSSMLDKHGDVSNGCEESSLEMKNLCFSFLCQVIDGLLVTRLKGITESLLQDWYRKLKFVRNRGFQIEFLVSNLEQVMLAYFGKKVRKSDSENVMTKLDQIDEKISRLLSDVALLKAEKKKHKEYFDKFGPYEICVNSQFLEQCKNKAWEFNWKIAGESLF